VFVHYRWETIQLRLLGFRDHHYLPALGIGHGSAALDGKDKRGKYEKEFCHFRPPGKSIGST
jgi:hypothetical protein